MSDFDDRLIEVPWDALEAETLQRLVEEFVTREGTDYGQQEIDLSTKVQQIIHGLRNRQWLIIVDTAMQSTHIVDSTEWRRALKLGQLPF